MNYEKIIIELLGRIQVLEEQMASLTEKITVTEKKEISKTTTDDIRKYIQTLKANAKVSGKDTIILRSGDIHKDMGLKNALPQVCNAMRQSMQKTDIILHTTPSGNSSTIEIAYKV